MLSDEEKEAIEEIKKFIKDKDSKYWIGINGEESVKIILNLVKKYEKLVERIIEQIKYLDKTESYWSYNEVKGILQSLLEEE